jgi:hypothetical protein
MMRKSRARAKRKRDELRRLLAESRSDAFVLMEEPCLESIPGLIHDLDSFIQEVPLRAHQFEFDFQSAFRMSEYREHILSTLSWRSIQFSDITPLIEDHRLDRIWRFITLIFMQSDHEIELTQDGGQIWVQRIYNETHYEGQGFPGAVESAF